MAQSNGIIEPATDFLPTLSFQLPSFAAKLGEDANRWLNEFERKTTQLSDERKINHVNSCLQRSAFFWFEDDVIPAFPELTWQIFKREFEKKFIRKGRREEAARRLKEMKFNIEETTLSSFIMEFKHWHQLINSDSREPDLILGIYEKLPFPFQSKISSQKCVYDFESLKEFETIAERVEDSMRIDLKHEAVLFAASEAKDSHMIQQILTEIAGLKQQFESLNIQTNRAKLRKDGLCFKCSKQWPACGCTSKCRRCGGSWPQCQCAKSTELSSSGNEHRGQPKSDCPRN